MEADETQRCAHIQREVIFIVLLFLKVGLQTNYFYRTDSHKRFLAYGRVPLKLITAFDANLEIDDNGHTLETKTSFFVIEKGQQPLMGKETAQKLGVLKIGLPSTHQHSVHRVKTNSNAFPKMKGITVTLPIDRSVPPVIQPLRRCPIPLLDKVK